jgi:hypothetical protein
MLGIRRNDPLRKLEWKYLLVSEQMDRFPHRRNQSDYYRLAEYRNELLTALAQLRNDANV